MSKIKTNVTVGCAGIFTENASFNKEFNTVETPKARRTVNGQIYATPQKLKYLMRHFASQQYGEKSVLIKQRKYLGDKGEVYVRNLEDTLQHVFGKTKKELDSLTRKEIYDLALTKSDVKNFGAMLPLPRKQVGIPGVSQISMGINLYKDTSEEEGQILSAFANSKEGEIKTQQTIGDMNFLDFASYNYNFTVHPEVLSENSLGIDVAQYTEDDMNWFKKAILRSPQYHTSASAGSLTGYALFVDIKDGVDTIQSNFDHYLSINKNEENDTYELDVELLATFLEKNMDVIENIDFFILKDNIKYKYKNIDKLESIGVNVKDMSESRLINVEIK